MAQPPTTVVFVRATKQHDTGRQDSFRWGDEANLIDAVDENFDGCRCLCFLMLTGVVVRWPCMIRGCWGGLPKPCNSG